MFNKYFIKQLEIIFSLTSSAPPVSQFFKFLNFFRSVGNGLFYHLFLPCSIGQSIISVIFLMLLSTEKKKDLL